MRWDHIIIGAAIGLGLAYVAGTAAIWTQTAIVKSLLDETVDVTKRH